MQQEEMKNSPDELRKIINGAPNKKNGKPVAGLLSNAPEERLLKEALSVIDKTVKKNSLATGITGLETIHQHKLLFRAQLNYYYVLGHISQELESLVITLMVEDPGNGRKERIKIDLYEPQAMSQLAAQVAERFGEAVQQVETELLQLTDLLEEYRENQLLQSKAIYQPPERFHLPMTSKQQTQALDLLVQPNLMEQLDKFIEGAGLIGEQRSRLLLFIAASTYKIQSPMHVYVQGALDSGRQDLVNHIMQCIPPEDTLCLARATSKSFYHYTRNELLYKVLAISDYDGLDKQARKALSLLQSNRSARLFTTGKDQHGNIVSGIKHISSHFASLLVTASASHENEMLVVGVDESLEQTRKIISYQNKRQAGLIDTNEEQQARLLLQNCIRLLKPCEVINPYADKIVLPLQMKMLRQVNTQYHTFVRQVVLFHQYQRKRDEKGRLVATLQDLKIAGDILFSGMLFNTEGPGEELNYFFTELKQYVLSKDEKEQYHFGQKEIWSQFGLSRAGCFRNIQELEKLGFVKRLGGFANKGFKYKITYWDDQENIRGRIKEQLERQIEAIKTPC